MTRRWQLDGAHPWCSHLTNASEAAPRQQLRCRFGHLAVQWVRLPTWGFPSVFCSNYNPKMFCWHGTHRQTNERITALLNAPTRRGRGGTRREIFRTDENGTELPLKVDEVTALNLTVLGKEHELGSSLVAGCQHVLCEATARSTSTSQFLKLKPSTHYPYIRPVYRLTGRIYG